MDGDVCTTAFSLVTREEMYGNQSGEFLSWPRLKFISLCPNTSSYQRLFIWKIGKKTKNVFLHVALFFCLYHLCRYYFYFILLSRYGFKIITVRWCCFSYLFLSLQTVLLILSQNALRGSLLHHNGQSENAFNTTFLLRPFISFEFLNTFI